MHVFGPDWWGFPLMSVFGVLLWVGLILAVIALVRRPSARPPSGGAGHGAPSSALRILEERYARGEITREEFHERRAVLTGAAPAPAPPAPHAKPSEPPAEQRPTPPAPAPPA